ncbi:MAG: nucleoside 2-deoxyribosyltransferase [bacterium]
MNYCQAHSIDCSFADSNESLPCVATQEQCDAYLNLQEQCDSYIKFKKGDYQIFIICSVRGTSKEYKEKLEKYVSQLEYMGMKVHLPHRDTNQNGTAYEICSQNAEAIRNADEVHIFYNSKSQGTHFDMGVSFALNKKIHIVENEEYGKGKSFPKMLVEWTSHQ